MLKLVSTTLTKNTSKLVETTIKDQIKQQVIPQVGKLISSAVSEQIPHGIADALAKVGLPSHVLLVHFVLTSCSGFGKNRLFQENSRG